MPVALAVLAVVLTLPSLDGGLILDDYYLCWTQRGAHRYQGITPSCLDLWRFFDGDPRRTDRMMDVGLVPWWTFRDIKGAFWRPVAAATHLVDFRLWPDSPGVMHAQSLLWYGVLVACVAMLYRRFIGPTWVAGLAGLLYAVDYAHALPVAMLANRNALLATLFGVLALIAHDRWRRDRWTLGVVVGPALLGASVLSAEAGVATCAYLLAYALFRDGGTWRGRLAALLPYAGVVVAWQALWHALGYGVYGLEEIYNPPFPDPLSFLGWIVARAPLYLLGQWALPPAEAHLLLGAAGQRWLWACGVAVMALLGVVLYPLCRRSRVSAFWAAGMLLALVPICATAPMSRQLLFVGLGAMALLAQLLQDTFAGGRSTTSHSIRWLGRVCLAGLFVLIHLVLAPVGLVAFSRYPLGPRQVMAAFYDVPGMDSSLETKDLILVNHPLPEYVIHLLAGRDVAGQPVPRHTRVLASSWSRLDVHRLDERTLVIRPTAGFLANLSGRLFRSSEHPMSLGEQVKLTGMTVTVTELTADKRPAEARFEFSVPLEDPSLRWIQWKDGAVRPFSPPEIGQRIELPQARLLF